MTGPRVFVSYSQDSTEHSAAVLALAQRLRGEGVDVRLDQFTQAPPEGWPRWMVDQLAEADFVLVVCTATYRRRFEGHEAAGVGRGANFEGLIVTQDVFERDARDTRYVPVLLPGAQSDDVPTLLRPFTRHVLPGGHEALLRHITRQPGVVPDPVVEAAAARYLEWLRKQPTGLDLIGVGGGDVQLELAEVYVPLRVAGLGVRPHAKDDLARGGLPEFCEDFELTDLFKKIAGRHALLLGRPGSGKTTALRKLVQQCLNEGPASLGLVDGVLPVFVRLRRFTREDLDRPLPEFIARELGEVSRGDIDPTCAGRLWQREVLLLLDGLDEIADEDLRARLCGYLADELGRQRVRAARVVVSSRPAGHDGRRVRLDDSFARCEIRPLDGPQVRALVRRWFAEAARHLPKKLTPEDARRQADALIAALEDPRFGLDSPQEVRMRVMVSTPLLLTLLCVVVQQGREMPRNRAAFYEECLRVMLLRWREAKGLRPLLDVDAAIALLRPLAYELQRAGQREEVTESALLVHIDERLTALGRGELDPLQVFEWLHRDAGVLTELAPQQYGFFHLGLQEYLAALQIASEGERLLDALADDFDNAWWHEVTRLLVSMPARDMFGPLMRRLLAGPALLKHTTVLRQCVLEAAEVDVTPFVERLERPREPARRQVEMLRLLLGRREPALVACAERLRAHAGDAEVRALAERVLAEATRPVAGAERPFDVVLVVDAADLPLATELATRLRGLGLKVWPEKGPLPPAAELVPREVMPAARVALVLVGGVDLWPQHDALIRLLQRRGQVHGVRLPRARTVLGASGASPRVRPSWWTRVRTWWARRVGGLAARALPAAEAATGEAAQVVTRWTDLRAGWQVDAIRALCEVIRPAGPAVAAQEPKAGDVWVEPRTGMRFVYVPAGRFQMGRTDGTEAERPVHWVRLSAFWLGEVPVTNREYRRFVRETKHDEPRSWREERLSDPEQPVVTVSWDDARAFCAWLREVGKVEARLPSEAQWEYAARGTEGRPYPWGDAVPDATRAHFGGRDIGRDGPARVGSCPAGRGPFGALDQAGNAWEWCEDTWNERAYTRAPELLDPVVDGGDAETRVVRGGSWYNGAPALAAACRCWHWSRFRRDLLGFRVVIAASRG
jgi:formylglycine-generating enzyme required for sulfatase activity